MAQQALINGLFQYIWHFIVLTPDWEDIRVYYSQGNSLAAIEHEGLIKSVCER
jgi:hypothetical protein